MSHAEYLAKERVAVRKRRYSLPLSNNLYFSICLLAALLSSHRQGTLLVVADSSTRSGFSTKTPPLPPPPPPLRPKGSHELHNTNISEDASVPTLKAIPPPPPRKVAGENETIDHVVTRNNVITPPPPPPPKKEIQIQQASPGNIDQTISLKESTMMETNHDPPVIRREQVKEGYGSVAPNDGNKNEIDVDDESGAYKRQIPSYMQNKAGNMHEVVTGSDRQRHVRNMPETIASAGDGESGSRAHTTTTPQAQFGVETAAPLNVKNSISQGLGLGYTSRQQYRDYVRPLGYGTPEHQSQQVVHTHQYQHLPRDQRPPRPTNAQTIQQQRQPTARHATSHSPESSLMVSTWKSIWGTVEKGLDSLADLEESVAGRAHQMLSTVTPRKKDVTVRSSVETHRWSNKAQRAAKFTTPTSQPLTPYGNKFEVAKKKEEEKKRASGQQRSWSEMTTHKMIRANGGASSSDGQQPMPPAFQQRSTYDNRSPPTSNGSPHHASEELLNIQSNVAQRTQSTANPYLQASTLRTPPKQPIKLEDPHSRAGRIPWDSSITTNRQHSTHTTPVIAQGPRAEYEIEKEGIMTKFSQFVKSISHVPNPLNIFRFKRKSYKYAGLDAWDAEDDDTPVGFFGALFRKKKTGKDVLRSSSVRPQVKAGEALAPPLSKMMERSDNGKTASLLLPQEMKRGRILGRWEAFFDCMSIMCVLVGVQNMKSFNAIPLSTSLDVIIETTLPALGGILRHSLETWAPVFMGYAYLTHFMKKTMLSSRIDDLATTIGSTVQDESQYAQLYLRLAAAAGIDPALPSSLAVAAASQVRSLVASARLNTFVVMILAALVAMTATIISPIFKAIGGGISEIFSLEELYTWPIAWQQLGRGIKEILQTIFSTIEGHSARSLNKFLDDPLQFAFHLSIFASAILVSAIPSIERRRILSKNDDDEEDIVSSSGGTAEYVAKLGASSANRLTMLSENGSIESVLERWRTSQVPMSQEGRKGSLGVFLRSAGYKTLAVFIATFPVAVWYLLGMTSQVGRVRTGLHWNSLMDVSVILVGLFLIASNAIQKVVMANGFQADVKSFVSMLSNTIDEIKTNNRRQTDLQFMASVSPTAGLVVRDLWAAHTTKRAWAVRGATFQCRNGEIVIVLGDDGAGKSRLLTTIAETLISPPRRSLTSNKVRGYVGIGGVESSKWDKTVLKERLGVLLSDVRTVADTANLYSGCSMESILEPIDGIRSMDGERKLGSSERSSILLALKMTGLFSSLIPKLPLKLSTILTSNEEDLRPSALRPRSHVLSPGEWSKLFLAKVLAQTIYDNDNAAASTDKVENCLVGSVLLLDEPSVFLSEVEEAKILKDLRQSGAATILATNKWATGRFADHIVVVRDGAIVESGTHNDLISRGPQQSLYAAKWHAMTTQ